MQLQQQQQQHQQQLQSQLTSQQPGAAATLSLNEVEMKLLQHLNFQQQLQQQLTFQAAQLKQMLPGGNSPAALQLQQLIQQLQMKYQLNNNQISSLIVIRNTLLQQKQQQQQQQQQRVRLNKLF
jgi:hypothetical protein